MGVRSLVGGVGRLSAGAVMVLSVGVGAAAAQGQVEWSPVPPIPSARSAAPVRSAPVQQAQVQPVAQPGDPFISELKLGVLYHDLPFLGTHKEKGADIDAEVLFASPDFLKVLLAPRPHLGISANTSGYTSQAYFGASWAWTLVHNVVSQGDGLFAGFSLGGALNDGKLRSQSPNRKSLGSHLLFRESLEGGYQFNSPFSLSVYADHISNAGLAKKNQGETNAGMRVGYKF